MTRLSVLLVEDSVLFAGALVNVLSRRKGIRVSVCSSRVFLRRTEKTGDDVVVIDAVSWDAGAENLVAAVTRTAPSVPVVLLGRDDLLSRHSAALRAGATGFLKQTASPATLLKAIRTVARGKTWFERKPFEKIFIQPSDKAWSARGVRLNANEKQVLGLVVQGKTNKEIGTVLGLKERTVKAYVSNLFRILGVTNRSGLTGRAIQYDLVPSTPNNSC